MGACNAWPRFKRWSYGYAESNHGGPTLYRAGSLLSLVLFEDGEFLDAQERCAAPRASLHRSGGPHRRRRAARRSPNHLGPTAGSAEALTHAASRPCGTRRRRMAALCRVSPRLQVDFSVAHRASD